MSVIETIIDIPAEHEKNVCGQFDGYLKKIERTLHVTIVARDGAIKLIGPELMIRRAKSVFNNLVELSKRGNAITEQNVDYALSLCFTESDDAILEIDKEKNIFRQTHLSGHGRRENDAEHAWHMAVMAYLLQEYSNEPVDVARVMLMCLLHDVVEIDAGDTYAYDADGLKTQKAREDAAKQRIYSLLPDDQKRGLMAVFDEFEADETAEAHFAHAMDNLQPLLLNNSNGGSDWADHDVTAKQVYGRQSRTEKGSAYLYKLTDTILQANIKKGALKEK